jgi:hypothetical protein
VLYPETGIVAGLRGCRYKMGLDPFGVERYSSGPRLVTGHGIVELPVGHLPLSSRGCTLPDGYSMRLDIGQLLGLSGEPDARLRPMPENVSGR